MIISIFAILGLLFAAPARADSSWDQHWKDCKDFRMPTFQFRIAEVKNLFTDGKTWDAQVQKELREIDDVANVTCKRWAENPNGDAPLQEFIRRYSEISASALAIHAQARNLLQPQLALWRKTEAVELGMLGYKLERFACGQAFSQAEKRVQENLQAIERSFTSLKQRCPKAADQVIAKARAEGLKAAPLTYGNGGPGRVPAGQLPGRQSDITGTKPEDRVKP